MMFGRVAHGESLLIGGDFLLYEAIDGVRRKNWLNFCKNGCFI